MRETEEVSLAPRRAGKGRGRQPNPHLGESLLLQVRNNTLSNQVAGTNNVEDLIVILAHESELESVLCRVNRDGSRFGVAIEAVHHFALDASEVHGLLQSLDDAVVAVQTEAQVSSRLGQLSAPPLERMATARR